MAYRTAKQVIIGNDDEDIEEFLHDNPNLRFSTYVKELIRADMERKSSVDPISTIETKLDMLLRLVQETGVAVKGQPAPAASAAQKKQISEGSKKAAASLMSTFNVKGGK